MVNDYTKYFNPPEKTPKGYTEYGYRGLEEIIKLKKEIEELKKEIYLLKNNSKTWKISLLCYNNSIFNKRGIWYEREWLVFRQLSS